MKLRMGKIHYFIFTFTGFFLFFDFSAMAQQEKSSAIPSNISTGLGALRKLIDLLLESSVKYSFQVLGGMIVLVAGWILAKFVMRMVQRFLEQHHVDVTIAKFLVSTVRLAIMAFAVLIALGKFGIEIAPFVAGLSVVGFGTSFALQGPLSNYAAGASLVFTKPFKVGDIIEVAGVVGEVEDMSLPRTEIRTIDGIKIFIPNKHIIGEIIQNFSEFKKIDIKVGIGYQSDVNQAIAIIKRVITSDQRIASVMETKVGIIEFGDSSINLEARIWCKQANYWDVLFDTNKKIFEEFTRQGIVIPFPQREVHLHKQ